MKLKKIYKHERTKKNCRFSVNVLKNKKYVFFYFSNGALKDTALNNCELIQIFVDEKDPSIFVILPGKDKKNDYRLGYLAKSNNTRRCTFSIYENKIFDSLELKKMHDVKEFSNYENGLKLKLI